MIMQLSLLHNTILFHMVKTGYGWTAREPLGIFGNTHLRIRAVQPFGIGGPIFAGGGQLKRPIYDKRFSMPPLIHWLFRKIVSTI